ncbi:MAG: hypothetical protein A4E57_03889 [Syntrophorhabdaceae bacterium PtaU1.Bin034]|nr:MAG: hypothetical protein A4E57_03889 [Syntrophorhabdaceae bacterium PtaU1.Bin034]
MTILKSEPPCNCFVIDLRPKEAVPHDEPHKSGCMVCSAYVLECFDLPYEFCGCLQAYRRRLPPVSQRLLVFILMGSHSSQVRLKSAMMASSTPPPMALALSEIV